MGPSDDLTEGAAGAGGVEAAEVNPRLGRKQREEREKGWVAAPTKRLCYTLAHTAIGAPSNR
jgi:hypothetical protein